MNLPDKNEMLFFIVLKIFLSMKYDIEQDVNN